MALPHEDDFNPYNDWDGSLMDKPIALANTWALKKYVKDMYFSDLLRFLKPEQTHVLDLGCGACSLMRFYHVNYRSLRSRVFNYLGVDGDEKNLDAGLDYVESMPQSKEKKAMELIHGDFKAKSTWDEIEAWIANQEQEGFDVIVATEIIEHFPRAFAVPFLKKIVTLLKPGGKVFFSTPVHYDDTALFWPDENYHFFEYKRDELEADISEAGLQIEEIHGNSIDTKKTMALFKQYPEYKAMYKKRMKMWGRGMALVLTDTEMCIDLNRPEYFTAILTRRE